MVWSVTLFNQISNAVSNQVILFTGNRQADFFFFLEGGEGCFLFVCFPPMQAEENLPGFVILMVQTLRTSSVSEDDTHVHSPMPVPQPRQYAVILVSLHM